MHFSRTTLARLSKCSSLSIERGVSRVSFARPRCRRRNRFLLALERLFALVERARLPKCCQLLAFGHHAELSGVHRLLLRIRRKGDSGSKANDGSASRELEPRFVSSNFDLIKRHSVLLFEKRHFGQVKRRHDAQKKGVRQEFASGVLVCIVNMLKSQRVELATRSDSLSSFSSIVTAVNPPGTAECPREPAIVGHRIRR